MNDDVLPKYESIKLSGKNLAQNYVSAYNTGMNIYQCINYLQGNIDWTIKAVNDVVKSWNTEVSESIDQSKAIVRETTTEQFNKEWTAKQPELIEQVNTLTTNQFNEDWGALENRINTTLETQNTNIENIQNEQTTLSNRMDTFSNPNLLINPDFKINQRGQNTYSSTGAGCTVDRWIGTNVNTVVNSDGTVSVSSLSGTGYYTQHEESISYGKHTYSVYVQAITGTVKAFYKSKDSKDVELGTLNQGLNTFTSVDDGFKSFFLSFAGGSSVTLKYAKVEQGTVATSFVSPNPAEELVKCRRYYNFIVAHFYGPSNPDGFINCDLYTLRDFRTSPTFNIKSTYSSGVTESTLAMKGTNANGYYLYARTVTSGKYALDVTIMADAEIY